MQLCFLSNSVLKVSSRQVLTRSIKTKLFTFQNRMPHEPRNYIRAVRVDMQIA